VATSIPQHPAPAPADAPARLLRKGDLFIAEPLLHAGHPDGSFLAVVAWIRHTLDCLCVVGWTCAAPERDGNYQTGCSVYGREQPVTQVAA